MILKVNAVLTKCGILIDNTKKLVFEGKRNAGFFMVMVYFLLKMKIKQFWGNAISLGGC